MVCSHPSTWFLLDTYLTFEVLLIGILCDCSGLTSDAPNLEYRSLLGLSQLVSENFIRENYLSNDSPVSLLQQCLRKSTGSGCKLLMRTFCSLISVILFGVSTNLCLLFPATLDGRGIK